MERLTPDQMAQLLLVLQKVKKKSILLLNFVSIYLNLFDFFQAKTIFIETKKSIQQRLNNRTGSTISLVSLLRSLFVKNTFYMIFILNYFQMI